jgi:hypothetical protein
MPEKAPTRRQKAALGAYARNGELNEGMIADECWPLVRNVRLVTNGLIARGLVTLGDWWGEGVGYELHPTDLGLRCANATADGALAEFGPARAGESNEGGNQ